MFRNVFAFCFGMLLVFSTVSLITTTEVLGQSNAKEPTEEEIFKALNQLDPRPLDPDIDPDIDMYIGNWRDSIPFNSHGSLVERAILTKTDGDPLKPTKKGEVLSVVNRLTRATLDPDATTTRRHSGVSRKFSM